MSCPLVVDQLAGIFRGKSSRHIPDGEFHAAQWWVDHQEPADNYREAAEPITKGGEVHWKTPYHDRLCYTANQFLRLKEPEKAFVIHGIENGVPWRGDEIKFYKMVCEETELMRKDKDAYIAQAFKKLKSFRLAA